MFKGLDHIVVAVTDLDAAIMNYEAIYGMPVSERSEAPDMGLKMAFFRFDDSYVELVSNLGEEGALARRLADRGEGILRLAIKVDSLEATLDELRAKGVALVGDPGPGNSVQDEVFVHPSATGGVLTQLVQS